MVNNSGGPTQAMSSGNFFALALWSRVAQEPGFSKRRIREICYSSETEDNLISLGQTNVPIRVIVIKKLKYLKIIKSILQINYFIALCMH